MQQTNRNAADHKNIGGRVMISTQGALRRLSLLAGSSLVAVGLSAGVFTVTSVTPTAAFAYDECVPADGSTQTDGTDGVSDPGLNGATSDNFACPEPQYPTGISYSSEGDLTVGTTTTSGLVQFSSDGIVLTGNGSDSVTWASPDQFIYSDTGSGPLLDVTTDTGDINITSGGLQAASPDATQGIHAVSTGGGDISIAGRAFGTTAGMEVFSAGGDITIVSAGTFTNGDVGVQATSTGGDVTITSSAGGQIQGRLRAILAETSGGGDVTINVAGDVKAIGSVNTGVPVIETTAGTGQTNIQIVSGTISAGPNFFELDPHATAIRSSSSSTSSVAVNVQNSGGVIYGAVDFSGVAAGGVTFINSDDGYWRAGGASTFSASGDTLIFASTLQTTINGQIPQNRILSGASVDFGGGDDLLEIQTGLNIGRSTTFNVPDLGALIDFGSGVDTLNNKGILSVEGPVTFARLEALNNSGILYLGSAGFLDNYIVDFFHGDTGSNDVLTAPGATFTGSGTSRVVAALHFDTSTQEGCAAPTGAGDCLYLPDGATAGSSLLTLINAGESATQGGFNPIGVTLIDVGGGTSAASHFTLDPNSEGYMVDPIYGPAISRPGLFRYVLRYDADTQRHNVVGLPRSEALEYVVLGSAAQSIWYMTSAAVTDRQTDLREGTEGSVWMKASGEYSKRDIANSVSAFADTYAFDNSYKLYAGTLMAGMDFITGHSGGYDYVLGGQIGYVGSSFDLNASPSSGQFTGATGGVYGSVWDGKLFLDGTLNTNFLTLDYDAPGLGSKTTTWLRSVGAQLEGGRRFMLTPKIFAEPLATVAFVNTAFEEISLDGGEVTPDEASSQRAALGLRLGADMFGGPLKVRYFVTGRAWQEFGAENEGVVFNPGQDLVVSDDAAGSFGEAQAGLSLFNADQTIAGFLTSGVKFKDGYNAVDLDLGLRLRW